MENKIKLKDLVWKETEKDKELTKLYKKWVLDFRGDPGDITASINIFNNVKQIAKEIEEIENKQIEYTKDDIIEMFVEAGFEFFARDIEKMFVDELRYCYKHFQLRVFFYHNNKIFFKVSNGMKSCDSVTIKFNDRKRIEFYYNTFREILKFEVEND